MCSWISMRKDMLLLLLCAVALLSCKTVGAAAAPNTSSNCTQASTYSGILSYFSPLLRFFGVKQAPSCNPTATSTSQLPNMTVQNSRQTNGTIIASFVQNSISRTFASNVSYSGYLRLVPSGFSFISIGSPIKASWYRSGKNASIYINATSVPIVGPVTASLSNETNGATLCTNFNMTAVAHNYLSILVGKRSQQCSTSSAYGTYLNSIENA